MAVNVQSCCEMHFAMIHAIDFHLFILHILLNNVTMSPETYFICAQSVKNMMYPQMTCAVGVR